jgi:CRP-like cAMP-binding protein
MDPDLKRCQILAELEEEEREAVAEVLETVELEAGVELFAEGEQGEGLCFVVEGQVQVESLRTGGATLSLGPGSALGAFSLVTSGPREVRAQTTSPSRVWVLRRSAFRRFADEEPRAACRLLEALLRDVARLGREALANAPADGAAEAPERGAG